MQNCYSSFERYICESTKNNNSFYSILDNFYAIYIFLYSHYYYYYSGNIFPDKIPLTLGPHSSSELVSLEYINRILFLESIDNKVHLFFPSGLILTLKHENP